MTRVKPSPTGAVLALATELKAAGRDIISLGTGEPDFDTPQAIKDAAISAIQSGHTKYTPIDGTAELKAAIARKFERDNGLRYTAAQIIALLGPGDEAIIPSPYWVSYPDMVLLAGAEPVIIEAGLDEGFKITPEQLGNAITSKTKLFFLNSPSNPTGASYSETELQALGEVLAGHDEIVVASDDIYEHIHWGREPFVTFAGACPPLASRTVVINGVSKAYAMTGWRIGYAAGPQELISAMKTVQSQSTSNPCSISQIAAQAALDGSQSVVGEMAAAYKTRHDFLIPELNKIPGFECRSGEGTFYAFPRVTDAMKNLELATDADLASYLLKEADVAAVPGSAFGAEGYLRLSFACSLETLTEAVERIKRAVTA
jgi:aspartate aminotransferase